jgi:hypothetical protein
MSPAGQLHRLRPVRVLDDELAAVVLFGAAQEERGGQIRADTEGVPGTWRMALSTWGAEVHARLVAVEERREHALGAERPR